MELLAWWNLVFLLPGGAGIFLVLLSVLGLGGSHDADHDVPVHHDHDHDLHHDAPLALPPHAGAPGHEAGHEPPGLVAGALSLLGVGRAPLTVVLTILCLSFGFVGFALNRALGGLLPLWQLFPVSLGTALVGSTLLTGVSARAIGRLVPREESYATPFAALEGQTGKIVLLLSPTEGYAQVHDRYGNLHEIHCRGLEGAPLRKDQPILVVQAQSDKRLCLVVENELERPALPDGESSNGV
jgi:YqiJ-like protein